ncbi:ectoine synthase [Nocardia neocaledoniensis]|uniref:L-ectoine synthase n=1 Tax=Nocardia neocaledoniensis TaxID=236511 RepID=A0A317N521_9NOCA|nr:MULTISPECIES: ectoine synthase [Nocardia]PWV70391.1 ectoine synthase [Nocardia neocaledoniensis]UGT56023.1 ectoine synthase [Nocardia asteroides]GEM34752.1 L-ectoine synthase [Nocardia neocaledoniensis NBRC 108232]
MIVRTTAEITGTERDVAGPGWRSKRIVLGGDKVGFSFHETTIEEGTVHEFHYQNHVEAVWLVEGEGTLHDLDNDTVYQLGPGTMYLLNGHERHQVTARTRLRMLCVFNPPVTGREVHDENGVYPLVVEEEDASV